MPAAVRIEGITDSTIDNCKFSNIGRSGLWIGRDCINIKVLNSTFEMICGNGINLGETDQAAHAKKIEI